MNSRVNESVQALPNRLDSLRWIIIGGFAALFALGVLMIWRKPDFVPGVAAGAEICRCRLRRLAREASANPLVLRALLRGPRLQRAVKNGFLFVCRDARAFGARRAICIGLRRVGYIRGR